MSGPIKAYSTTLKTDEAYEITGSVVAGFKRALDVQVAGGTITGTFSPSGLRIAILITTMDVGDTEVALPVTPLADRNAISIENLSTTDTLYIGPTGVTADRVVGTTSGKEVGPQESFALDITDEIVIYGRAETGKTVMIKVTEIA